MNTAAFQPSVHRSGDVDNGYRVARMPGPVGIHVHVQVEKQHNVSIVVLEVHVFDSEPLSKIPSQ